jgi:cysteine desulfurase
MMPFLTEGFGNANSVHQWGLEAHEAVETARTQVAELLHAEDPGQIFFTSGATESNNWIVSSTPHGLYSPFEHSSLREAAIAQGWAVWPNQAERLLAYPHQVEVASLMAVNNEIGTIWDIRNEPVQAAKLHVDATQIVGKLAFTVRGLDYVSMSAHKLYGPKGVGALFCSESPPAPILHGGEQEQGVRAGTSNVAAIVGFGAAADLAGQEMTSNEVQTRELKELFLEELRHVSDWEILGGPKTSPFILGLRFDGVEGETLVIEADHRGYAISSGAACSSRSSEPSHVLKAIGLDEEKMRGSVRISFGKANDLDSTRGLARTLAQSVELLRTMTGGL